MSLKTVEHSDTDLGLDFMGKGGRDIYFLSKRINELQLHFKSNPKDLVVAKAIVQLVHRRKKLISFISSKDPKFYKQLTEIIPKL